MFKTPEEIRNNLNLTQKEFAKKIGSNYRRYQDRIYNRPDWRISELIEIAKLNGDKVMITYKGENYLVSTKKVK